MLINETDEVFSVVAFSYSKDKCTTFLIPNVLCVNTRPPNTITNNMHCTRPNALHRTNSYPSDWLHGMFKISHITAASTTSLLSMCHVLRYYVLKAFCQDTEMCQDRRKLPAARAALPVPLLPPKNIEAGAPWPPKPDPPKAPPNIPGVPAKNGCGRRS